MRIILPENICDKDFELSDLFGMYQKCFDQHKFTMESPRKSSALLYFYGCSGKCYSDTNKALSIPQGSLLYIPATSTYTFHFNPLPNAEYLTALIEFNMIDKDGLFSLSETPFIITNAFILENTSLILDTIDIYFKPSYSPILMKSNVYLILHKICMLYKQEIPAKYRNIEQGIIYLENNILVNINVEELAKMCHVSSACFRRLFKEYSGMSPIEYHIAARMKQAKKMLSKTNLSIESISYSLNFSSASYFCRLFKEKYNLTPTEYRNKHNYHQI